ncbi:glutamate 5-kinase [Bacillaceae bacterium]
METKSRKRIVVKIGSSSLTNKSGGLSTEKLAAYVEDIARLKGEGHEVVLVSSGAVAAGFKALGYPARPVTIEGKQAAAAVGQGLLIEAYNKLLKAHGCVAAQLLLTRADFAEQERYRNAYNTLSILLKRGIIPIINENDTVSVDELTFGDNDILSALVAGMIHADFLMILTDTNGLYTANPLTDPEARRFDFVAEITPEIEAAAGTSGSKVGTGGMKSKLEAAKRAVSLGIEVFIGKRSAQSTLLDVLHHRGDGTYFSPAPTTLRTTKQWIAFHSGTKGRIQVDDGAKQALLHDGGSLLLPGITAVFGDFQAGDVVEVIDLQEQAIGRGKVNYSAKELLRLKWKKENREKKSFIHNLKEVIHRDEWVSHKEREGIFS